jgi:hypothetical protein
VFLPPADRTRFWKRMPAVGPGFHFQNDEFQRYLTAMGRSVNPAAAPRILFTEQM